MKFFVIVLLCAVSAYAFPETRIVNGELAKLGEFPYQAAIFISSDGLNGNKCGGILVARNRVLTAAHCFEDALSGTLWLGSTKYFEGQEIKFYSNNVHVHEDYDPKGSKYDIAVIDLPTDADIDGETIDTVQLRYQPLNIGEIVTISGFGLIKDDEDTDDLRHTTLRVVDGKNCNYRGYDDKTMVCLEGEYPGQSTCQGDSGGPGVIRTKKGSVLVGIVHGGGPSCEMNYKNMFTRISAYEAWILEHIY